MSENVSYLSRWTAIRCEPGEWTWGLPLGIVVFGTPRRGAAVLVTAEMEDTILAQASGVGLQADLSFFQKEHAFTFVPHPLAPTRRRGKEPPSPWSAVADREMVVVGTEGAPSQRAQHSLSASASNLSIVRSAPLTVCR